MAMRETGRLMRVARLAFVAVIVASVMFLSSGKAYAAGEGTASGTVSVSTVEELSAVSDRVAAGDSMAGVVVQLQNDLDMSKVNFEPIGTSRNAGTSGVPFAGTFDGQGHALKGLMVYTTMTETHVHQWHGLFGACDGATIENLTIDGCTVESTSMVTSYVSVLCPEVANSTIENVTLTGKLSCSAGMVLTAKKTTFKNCVLDYTQNALSSGIVQEAYEGCVIEGCSATGTVDASVSAGDAFGVMAGKLTDSTVSGCTNDATVIGRMNEAGYMGSMVGYANNSAIDDCVNRGSITLTNEGMNNNMEPVGGYAGGIVGGMEKSTVTNCFNYGDIFNRCIHQGRTANPQTEYPAGVVSVAMKGSKVISCASTGDIDIDLMGYNMCLSNAAGIVAKLQGSTMQDCYNTGNMSANLTTYFTSKDPMRLQFNGSGIALLIDDDATVSNCYNTGTMEYECQKETSLESQADPVSLDCKGKLSNVYYYRGSWPAGSTLGTPLTATQMKKKASFDGFNFSKTWVMDSGAFGLPVLKVEGEVERESIADDVDFTAAVIGKIGKAVYDGTAHEPAITITIGGEALVEGTDYLVTYADNVNAGTAKVTATGLGCYVGDAKATFEIEKAANTIELKKAKFTFKASVLKSKDQSFTIDATAATKVKYTLSSAAKKAGMTVTPKGKVTVKKGTKSGTYKISVNASANKNYKKASAKTVTVKVK